MASKSEIKGDLAQAFIWPKCMPEIPEDVFSFILDQPCKNSSVVSNAEGGESILGAFFPTLSHDTGVDIIALRLYMGLQDM